MNANVVKDRNNKGARAKYREARHRYGGFRIVAIQDVSLRKFWSNGHLAKSIRRLASMIAAQLLALLDSATLNCSASAIDQAQWMVGRETSLRNFTISSLI